MTELTSIGAEPGAEPTRRVNGRFVAALTAARVGLAGTLIVPPVILLPRQVELFGGDQVANLAIFYTVTGSVGLVVSLLVAALCDRAAARYGRRQPWVVGGAALAAAGLLGQAVATSLAAFVAAGLVLGLGLAALGAAVSAAIPDSVPRRQRGWVSAWAGAAESVALVGGVSAAAQLSVTGGYVLLAVLIAGTAAWFVLATPEAAGLCRPQEPWRWSTFLARFWVNPRRHPDFSWAWLTRLAFVSSQAMGTAYLFFLLRGPIRFEQAYPGRSVNDGLVVLTLTLTVALLATTFAAGAVADRSGRRKVFVIGGGLLYGAGDALVAITPTWPALVVATVLWGAGQGLYQAMDLAIVADVLPSAADRSRHLAVADLANVLPNSIAPGLGGALIIAVGGFSPLYWLIAVGAVLTGLLVLPIRSIR